MENTNDGLEQANAQMSSVCAMVAALEVDYDRLEELRDEQAALLQRVEDGEEGAAAELAEWQDGYGEEYAELLEDAGDCESLEDAERAIDGDPLDIDVRSGWTSIADAYEDGLAAMGAEEFRIVLCTGGPHVQIRGTLRDGSPDRARLEYADWGTGMTERVNRDGDQDALVAYASRFLTGC